MPITKKDSHQKIPASFGEPSLAEQSILWCLLGNAHAPSWRSLARRGRIAKEAAGVGLAAIVPLGAAFCRGGVSFSFLFVKGKREAHAVFA